MLAPTGTISFMMDCDTTGVEPDFSLVKSKRLVGGGEITIVNKTVPMALDKLGYAPSEIDEIVAYIDERNTIVGAPYVKSEHYPVFDCAIGDRAIHYSGHVKMMGAVQPFISGAISKTVNLPEQATVDEVAQLIADAWRLGVKAIAIYRDNCKVAQPLSGKSDGRSCRRSPPTPLTQRRRLPEDRTEVGRKFRVGDYEGYIHVGLYEDGSPGDIFVDIAKDGTTMAGLMNSLMIAVSMGLQYGVPPEVYVSKLSHMRFEPSGLTNDADIRVAKSIVDYIFRWFGKKFLTPEQQEEAGILSPEVKARLAERYAERRRRRFGRRRARVAAAGPDRALQLVGGRGRVREVRRPDGAHRLVLHVPRLRDEHRLQLSFQRIWSSRGGRSNRPPRPTSPEPASTDRRSAATRMPGCATAGDDSSREGDAARRPRRRRRRARLADPRRHVRARRLLGAELPRVQGRAARRTDLGVPALGRAAPIHRRYKVRECDVLVASRPRRRRAELLAQRAARRADRSSTARRAFPHRGAVRDRARPGLADRARATASSRRKAGRWATWPCSAPACKLLLPDGLEFLEQAIASRMGARAEPNIARRARGLRALHAAAHARR